VKIYEVHSSEKKPSYVFGACMVRKPISIAYMWQTPSQAVAREDFIGRRRRGFQSASIGSREAGIWLMRVAMGADLAFSTWFQVESRVGVEAEIWEAIINQVLTIWVPIAAEVVVWLPTGCCRLWVGILFFIYSLAVVHLYIQSLRIKG
jgi:hypothetical protein